MNFFILHFIIFFLFHASYYNYYFGEKRSQYTLTRNAIWTNHCPRSWTKETVYEKRLWLTSPNVTKSGNFLLVDTGIQEVYACGIWILRFGIRSPTNGWNRESKFHWQRIQKISIKSNPKSTAWNPESNTALDSLTWGDSRQTLINLFNDPCFHFTCLFIVQGSPPPPKKKMPSSPPPPTEKYCYHFSI